MNPLSFASISAALLLGGALPGQAPAVDPPQMIKAFTSMGIGIGQSGFVPSTEPGLNEFYLDGYVGGSFWHAMRYDAGEGTYAQTYASPILPSNLRRIDVFDLHPSPGDEIFILMADGTIRLHRQSSKLMLEEFATGVDQITAFDHYDWDGDGREEIALLGSGGLHLFESDGTALQTYPGFSGSDMAIGQMDGDPGAEIAFTDGTVLDLDSGLIQCDWAAGFGYELELSDFDNDGMEEIVFSERWNFAWAFDVDTCLPKWSISVFNIDAVTIGDGDGDGHDELILGEAQWGNVTAYDLVTRAVKWSIHNPEHGTTSVAVFDADMDGQVEVIWGAGHSSSGEDIMYVGDATTQSIEWESQDLVGPFLGPVVGDVDGDGVNEIVTISRESDSGYGAGRIVVLEPDNLVPRISQETMRGLGWTGVKDIELYDVTGDGTLEILLAGSTTYDGLLEIYDYAPGGIFTLIWDNNVLPRSATFQSVDVADLDGDGSLEILGGTGSATTGSSGNFVYVYDYASGDEEWHSLQMGSFWDQVSAVEHGDFDADGDIEIAGMVEGGDVYIFHHDSTLEAILTGDFSCMRLGPEVGSYGQSLLLGSDHGAIDAYYWNGSGYQIHRSLNPPLSSLEGFTFAGRDRLFTGADGVLTIHALPTGRVMWQSANFGTNFGSEVVVLDDGVFVSAGINGVFAFRP